MSFEQWLDECRAIISRTLDFCDELAPKMVASEILRGH
jgi:hypothetical protein